jgi:hypothetical protein
MLEPHSDLQFLERSLNSFEGRVSLEVVGLLNEGNQERTTGDNDCPAIAGESRVVDITVSERFLHIFFRQLEDA